MVLSGCKSLYSAAAVKANLDTIQEDTLAHEEVFREVEFRQRKPFKADPVLHPDPVTPAIGYQFKEEGGAISFRVIAAVNIANEDMATTTAVWTRSLAKTDGSTVRLEGDRETTRVYTSLSNGEGDPYTIADFNSDNSLPENTYNYFVVYTILDISQSTYDGYYLNAFLTLTHGDDHVYSKAVSLAVDKSTQFAFNPLKGYFLYGKIDGNNNTVVHCDETTDNPSNNVASFRGQSFDENDKFVLYKNEDTKLTEYSYSSKADDAYNFDYYFDDDDGITTKYEGDYNFYFSKGSKLYYGVDRVVRKIYISTSGVSWFANDGYKAALYAWGGKGNAWLDLDDLGGGNYSTSDPVDTAEYDKFIVGRTSPSNFNNVSGFGDVPNKTGNVESIGTSVNDLIELYDDMNFRIKMKI